MDSAQLNRVFMDALRDSTPDSAAERRPSRASTVAIAVALAVAALALAATAHFLTSRRLAPPQPLPPPPDELLLPEEPEEAHDPLFQPLSSE